MPQGRHKEDPGTGEWLVDAQFVERLVVETEARNCIFGNLTWRAVSAELEPRVWTDQRVLVDEGEVVGGDVGEVDSAAQAFPSSQQCREDGLVGRRRMVESE